MKSRLTLIFLFVFWSNCSFAFDCTYDNNSSKSISLSDVKNIGDEVVLYNFLAETCSGILQKDYQDAMRISNATKFSVLSGSGLDILFKSEDGNYHLWNDSIKGRCIWPTEGTYCAGTNYNNHNYYTYSMKGKVILRRVSGTQSGITIPAGSQLASLQFQQRGYGGAQPIWTNNYYNVTFRNADALEFPTCSIEASSLDQLVALPPVSKSEFSGIGSTAGQVPFQYRLNCDSGVTVNLTVEDSSDLSNTGDIFRLQSDATATGVGIQMLHDGTPVSFKESKTLVSSAVQGMNLIDFSARYIKIADDVQPGRVIAKAIISFDYL
ncbi:fimbrial protein [Vibrio jasicida]|uniref:fimbrial protein n=1 Tax=Vibrio jasicida TaxID=766224 RepID=UPI000CE3BEF6|nr:fimbrial protein [Vibrio jasicida]